MDSEKKFEKNSRHPANDFLKKLKESKKHCPCCKKENVLKKIFKLANKK